MLTDESSKIIEVKAGETNLTLPCNPKLQNSIQSEYTDLYRIGCIPPFHNQVTSQSKFSIFLILNTCNVM